MEILNGKDLSAKIKDELKGKISSYIQNRCTVTPFSHSDLKPSFRPVIFSSWRVKAAGSQTI